MAQGYNEYLASLSVVVKLAKKVLSMLGFCFYMDNNDNKVWYEATMESPYTVLQPKVPQPEYTVQNVHGSVLQPGGVKA